MPDEAAAAPEQTQGTPQVEAPQEGTPSQEETVNWQERYQNLQADHTRASQEAAEYRQAKEALHSEDPELRRAAADYFGVQFEEPEEGGLDELEEIKREMAELKQGWTTQQEQAAQQQHRQQEIEILDVGLSQLEESEGVQFSEAEVKLLASVASQVRDNEGNPDIQAAYKLLQDADTVRSERRVKSKKKAPQVQSGSQGSEKWDRRNSEERIKRMAARMQASE